jgi:hypothetical protein
VNPVATRAARPGIAASLAFLVLVAAAFLVAVPGPEADVLLPMAVTCGVGFALLALVVARGGGRYAALELGPVYAAVVVVYTLYPLLGFLVNGLRYGDLNDNRLFAIQPAAKDVARLAWLYVAHLGGFALVYVTARGRTGEVKLGGRYVSRFALTVLFALWVVIQLYFVALQRHYNWLFETNLDRYVAIANLPLLVAQVTGHLSALQFTIEVAFLVLLFAYSKRALFFVIPWLGFVAVVTLIQRQSRTEIVLLTLAAVVCFHLEVRPLSTAFLSGLAAIGLAGFVFFGASRDGFAALDVTSYKRLFIANEFESLFGNACDLDQRVAGGEIRSLTPAFFASDLLALVPQQLVSVAKVSPPSWYMKTFFPEAAERGIGFCFGTVSESIVGGGLPDAVARGAALALIFGAIHRFISKHRPGAWWFIFYVWLTVMAYNSFRMTTFYLLLRVVYDFLPIVILVKGAHAVFGICRRGFSAKPSATVAS